MSEVDLVDLLEDKDARFREEMENGLFEENIEVTLMSLEAKNCVLGEDSTEWVPAYEHQGALKEKDCAREEQYNAVQLTKVQQIEEQTARQTNCVIL